MSGGRQPPPLFGVAPEPDPLPPERGEGANAGGLYGCERHRAMSATF